ncbi:MAG: mandelate racemase/muconate lactonizing enzyme family protein [Candidatus Rokubacteria bacterium]|nr:mandelate racemase/muconate lactonizing enzyme family protein [Candidatus Rokubacteria bacterium]
MKITEIKTSPLSIPFRPMKPPSLWTDGIRKQLVIELRTDEGVVGVGEAFAYGAPLAVANVITEVLTPLLIGEDPTQIERLAEKMHRATFLYGRRGLAMMAISGVELALWDAAGKARGVPVYELLGGLVTPRVRAYASLHRYRSPAEVGEASRDYVSRGFSAIKLHQTDVESVATARAAVGPSVEIMLDVNCVWNPREAIAMARRFAPFDLAWLEEPVWPPEDYRGLAEVAAQVETPIAAGENEATTFGFREMIAQRAADILQPSVTKVGGLLEFKKICGLAAAANLSVAPHSFYFGPGLAATLHLIASTPGCLFVEFPTGELETPLLTNPIQAKDGHVEVPAGPGFGVQLNDEALSRYPYSGEGTRPFILT